MSFITVYFRLIFATISETLKCHFMLTSNSYFTQFITCTNYKRKSLKISTQKLLRRSYSCFASGTSKSFCRVSFPKTIISSM